MLTVMNGKGGTMTLEVFIYGLGLIFAIGISYLTGYMFGFADGMKRQIDRRLRKMEREK